MSPLALLYILFASSPLLNNWHHESTSPSTWNAMPFEHESFEHYTPSFWGAEESTYTPEHLNWLLRKAVRSTEERYPTSIRSIIAEMTGRRSFFNEEPRSMFEKTESVRPIVHLIRRIAEVNPIMIEKILSCPITRRFVEKVLRNVEPETLYMVEKMIRKNVPVNIREKVVRRVLKNLLTKSSSVFGRRSILSEMYPTEESLFSTSTRFHAEEPMIKNLIEKLLRRSEVPEVVLAKIIRKLIKLNKVSPVEKLFSTRRYSKEEPIRHLIEKLFSTRHFNVESIFGEKSYEPEVILSKVLSKVLRKSSVSPVEELLSTIRHSEVSPVEKLFSTKSFAPESRMIKKIVKLVKNMKKNVKHTEMPEEFFCNYVCESNTFMRPEFSNMCDEVCHNYESSWESPVFGKHFGAKKMTKLIKKLSKEQF